MASLRFRALAAGALLGILAVQACSESPDRTAEPQPTLTTDEEGFAQQLAQAVCSGVEDCCVQAGFELDAFCEHNGEDQLRAEILQARAAGASFDGAAASSCLAEWQSALADCALDDDQRTALTEACRGVFAGQLPPGSYCTDDGQCQHPAGGFALCDAGGVAAGRCVDNACEERCDAPTQPFVTWKTCDGAESLDGYCHDQCYYPPAGSACMMVCWCCVDNANQTCEFTAFQSSDVYERHLCTDGHYSPGCREAEQDAHVYCDGW